MRWMDNQSTPGQQCSWYEWLIWYWCQQVHLSTHHWYSSKLSTFEGISLALLNITIGLVSMQLYRFIHHWFRWWPATGLVPSRYLKQCWNIINWTLRNKLQWNFNRNSNIFIKENAFENGDCKMASILSLPQCVDFALWSVRNGSDSNGQVQVVWHQH